MSTRKLILTALVCGMAILIAGSVQLLRLNSSDSSAAQVFEVGESTTIADVEVTVVSADPEGPIVVRMALPEGGSLPAIPLGLWTLQLGDVQSGPSSELSSCAEMEVLPAGPTQECTLDFGSLDGTSYLRFARDGAVVTWVLKD